MSLILDKTRLLYHILLSPSSSPSGVPPTTSSPPSPSITSAPPSPATTSSPPSPSTSSLSPPSQTNQTTEPPSSSPPPQSPPASPPPSPPSSPPPSAPLPSSPPPPLLESPPPPSTPTSPPPSRPISQSPPPPPTSSLPSAPPSPPPLGSSSLPPPPPDLSPPPPSNDSPPPQSPPDTRQKISPSSVPPPANDTTPTSSNFPPPPSHKSPERSPPPPRRHSPPPPLSQSEPPPAAFPPTSPLLPETPPPSIPSSSSPPSVSPTFPTNSSSQSPNISPLPKKPTPETTPRSNVTANGSSVDGKQNSGPVVAIAVVVGFMLLSLIVMGVWFVKRRKRRNKLKNINYSPPSPFNSSQNSDSSFLRSRSPVALVGSRSGSDFTHSSTEACGMSNSRGFTYEDLVQATNSFSAKNILGEGGFGCVYKGTLPDGREVAVKQLKIGSGQGEREFRAEVEIISRVHHRHLVSLVGYCISEYERLLVYDYVPNNTLHYHLHAHSALALGWATRVRIAAGAARGIAYLHEDCHPRIIHRDIKSSNILLDVNFEARVADFGLAKLALDSHTHVTTRVMGTFGYMAPEYATSGKLTDKSDVFSFGVVLLELITGRKPVDSSQPLGDESLVEWARPLLAQVLDDQNFEEFVDPKLEKNYVASEMFRMIEAAAACVRYSAVKRPRMSQVVRALDCLDEMSDLANGVKPGQSGVIDSVEHSAQIRMFQRMAFGSREFSTGYFDRDRSQSQSSWRGREYDDDLSSTSPFNRSGLSNN